MKSLFLALLAILFTAACRKAELPDDLTTTPEFSVSISLQDSAFAQTLTAGVDGRYLFTSHERDASDVVTMRGAFAPADCPQADCGGTLTFEFRNYTVGEVVLFPQDTAVIRNGYHAYRQPSGDSLAIISQLTFSVVNPDSLTTYFWTVEQQGQLVAEGDGPILARDFNYFEPLTLELNFSAANGFLGSSRSEYRFDQPLCPQVTISTAPDSLTPLAYILTASSQPSSGSDAYLWNTGDTSTTITVDSTGLNSFYQVTVTNSQGCVSSASANQVSAGVGNNQSPQVNIQRQDTLSNISLQLGRVALQWIRPESGEILRSDGGLQPSESYFLVGETQLYENNERGEKTNRMRVEFRCLLFNALGEGFPFTGSGTIAVAYP